MGGSEGEEEEEEEEFIGRVTVAANALDYGRLAA